MVLNAVRRVHAAGVFHELAMLVAEDRHKYERELLLARRRAEELLVQERAAQAALALAEARLRLALESAQLYVWDVDPDGGGRRYEDGVALLLGRAVPGPVDADDYAGRIDAADREREAAAFAHTVGALQPGYACTYRLHGVDGRVRIVSSTGRAVHGPDGALARFVGVLQDVSEPVRLREAAEVRAVFAEQMMGIVSHDLRNPLAAIRMSLMLLERAPLEPRHRLAVGRIGRSLDRAHRLIGDLLDFTSARIGAGIAVRKAPIDLHAVVAEAVGELRLAFDGRALVHQAVGEGACEADADRLAQLLGNLVANAMTYGAADGTVSVVSTRRRTRLLARRPQRRRAGARRGARLAVRPHDARHDHRRQPPQRRPGPLHRARDRARARRRRRRLVERRRRHDLRRDAAARVAAHAAGRRRAGRAGVHFDADACALAGSSAGST